VDTRLEGQSQSEWEGPSRVIVLWLLGEAIPQLLFLVHPAHVRSPALCQDAVNLLVSFRSHISGEEMLAMIVAALVGLLEASEAGVLDKTEGERIGLQALMQLAAEESEAFRRVILLLPAQQRNNLQRSVEAYTIAQASRTTSVSRPVRSTPPRLDFSKFT
jgi:hypothetical protein